MSIRRCAIARSTMQQQVIGIDRLGQEVHRAFAHRRHRVLDAAVGGHDDDRQLGVELLGGAQDAEAVALRQLQVGQDDRGPRLPQLLRPPPARHAPRRRRGPAASSAWRSIARSESLSSTSRTGKEDMRDS